MAVAGSSGHFTSRCVDQGSRRLRGSLIQAALLLQAVQPMGQIGTKRSSPSKGITDRLPTPTRRKRPTWRRRARPGRSQLAIEARKLGGQG